MVSPIGLYDRLGFSANRFQRAPIAIAHRGASAYALENSETAFRKAAELGADMWEIDIQLSADNVCVVSHNNDLGTMASHPRKISESTWQELSAIPLNNGERLLSLGQAIDLATTLNSGLYIEIKAEQAGLPACNVLEEHGFDRAVIGSLTHAVVRELRDAGCGYPLSVLVPADVDPFMAAEETGADIIHLCWLEAADLPQTLITSTLLQEVKRRGLSIVTWHEERRSVLDALEQMPIFAICSNRPETIKPYHPDRAHPIRLVCHRGANYLAPENTLEAARICFGQGFDFVEVDLRTASDGALVVIHDGTVDRTTNGSGYVAKMSLPDLQALDAGSWFDPHFGTEIIPTLGEMLALAATYGRGLYIELKSADPAELLREVGAHDMLGSCFFGAMMPDVMRAIRRVAPEARLMARRCDFPSLEAAINDCGSQIIEFDPARDDLDEIARCPDLDVASMILDRTCSSLELERLRALEPDYLNLDRPDLFKQIVGATAGHS